MSHAYGSKIVGVVLKACMAASIVALIIGLTLYSASPAPSSEIDVSSLPRGLLIGDAMAWLALGLLMVIAAPALRALAVLTVFLREREMLLAAITVATLTLLALAIWIGVNE